jgi:hypothetical protein
MDNRTRTALNIAADAVAAVVLALNESRITKQCWRSCHEQRDSPDQVSSSELPQGLSDPCLFGYPDRAPEIPRAFANSTQLRRKG